MSATKLDPDQDRLNPGADEFEKIINSNFSDQEKGRLSREANSSLSNNTSLNKVKQAEKAVLSPQQPASDDLAKQESSPWKNEVTPNPSSSGDKGLKGLFQSRKNWVIFGSLVTLITGIITFAFGALTTAVVSFKEVNYEGTHKRNITRSAQRAAKVAEKTYFNDADNCEGIRCKLRASLKEKDVKRLERQGGVKSIDYRESSSKPGRFVINSITLSDGTVLDKSNFVQQFKDTPSVRSFHATASKSRGTITRTVNVVKKLTTKLGLSRQNPLKDGKDEKDFKRKFRQAAFGVNSNRLTSNVSGETNAQGEPVDPEAVLQASGIDQEIQEQARAERDRLLADPDTLPSIVPSPERASRLASGVADGTVRGLRVDGILQNTCTAYSYIKVLSFMSKVYRALALIKYAYILMSFADAIKTGEITAEQVAFIMGMLLSTNKEGKNFADSPGWQYLVNRNLPNADSIDRYQMGPPGAQIVTNALQTINKVTNGEADTVCNIAQSTPFQVAAGIVSIAAAIFTGGGSIIASVGLGAASGFVFGALEAYVLPLIVQAVAGVEYSGDEDGFQIGTIVAAGMGALSSQIGRSQGLRPLAKAEVAANDAETNRLYDSMFESSKPSLTDKITTNMAFLLVQMSKSSALFTPQLTAKVATQDASRATVFAIDETLASDTCRDPDKQALATDIFCNELYSESTGVLMDDPKFDPEVVQNYMIDNNFVDLQSGEPAVGENGDEFRNYRDVCMDGTIPLVKSPVDGISTGNYDNIYDYCTSTEEKFTYFRLFRLDMNITESPDEVDKFLSQGSGVIPGGSLAEVDTSICQGGSVGGTAKITCSSYQFDNFGYLWGGGHSGTAEAFMSKFKAGGFRPGESSILDCSGMIRMAIYDAHGVDVGGFTTSTLGGHSQFKEVPLEQGQAGDIVWYPGHVELVVKNDVAAKRFDTFGAHTAGIPFNEQIGPAKFPYSKIQKVYRYVGPTR